MSDFDVEIVNISGYGYALDDEEFDFDVLKNDINKNKTDWHAETKDKFPGMIVKHSNSDISTFTIYENGNFICTGSRDYEIFDKSCQNFVDMMNATCENVDMTIDDCLISNLVAVAIFNERIPLEVISFTYDFTSIEYEPELFPGLIWRFTDPTSVFIVFATGKLVCTGAGDIETYKTNLKKISKFVDKINQRY